LGCKEGKRREEMNGEHQDPIGRNRPCQPRWSKCLKKKELIKEKKRNREKRGG